MESGKLSAPRTGTLTFPSLLANSSAIRGIETPCFTHPLYLCPLLLQKDHCPAEFSSLTQIKHTRNKNSRALGLLEASRQVLGQVGAELCRTLGLLHQGVKNYIPNI